MNCKPGDLAMVVKSPNGRNYGKVVRCIEVVPKEAQIPVPSGGFLRANKTRTLWRVEEAVIVWEMHKDRILQDRYGYEISRTHIIEYDTLPYISDEYLMPIRPDELKDEVQTCNVPVEVAL